MNKEVFYIEPEYDIADVVSKIKNTDKKVVAIIPNKDSAAIFRSAVNLKLINKTATQHKKAAVIITEETSLQKLAIASGLPFAKSLNTRPVIPSDNLDDSVFGKAKNSTKSDKNTEPESAEDSDLEDENMFERIKATKKTASAKKEEIIDSEDIESDEVETKQDDEIVNKSFDKRKIPDFKKYQKFIIAGAAGLFILVVFAIWASVFAPSAKIAVSVRTTASNFSENINFVTKNDREDAKTGIFLLEQQKIVKTSEVKFKATGQKNIGEKAKGSISVSVNFTQSQALSGQSVKIPAGTKFVNNKKEYISTEVVSLSASDGHCDNQAGFLSLFCAKSKTIKVSAAESGEKYNLKENSTGWSTSFSRITVKGNESISGGTDKIVTVIQKNDIIKAKELLASANEKEGKAELMKKIPNNIIVIDSTFSIEAKDPVSVPKIDEEIKEDVEPTLKAETTFMIYGVDKTRVEEYIKDKSKEKIAEDQKIYTLGAPFIERFTKDESKKYFATAKLKSTIDVGPKITEQDILEKSKGRKVGEVQSLIKSINGVSTVSVDTSYFWVRNIPDDANKVTIELKVEK